MTSIQPADFPSICQASDKASLKSQKTYLILMGFDLIAMLLGALLFIYNFQTKEEGTKLIYSISAFLLFSATILTFIVKIKKYEDTWFQGRALSESTKTLTWRFVTCSENFESDLRADVVEEKFISIIKELSAKFVELNHAWIQGFYCYQ